MESKCATCPMKEKAEKNPRGFLAMLLAAGFFGKGLGVWG